MCIYKHMYICKYIYKYKYKYVYIYKTFLSVESSATTHTARAAAIRTPGSVLRNSFETCRSAIAKPCDVMCAAVSVQGSRFDGSAFSGEA